MQDFENTNKLENKKPNRLINSLSPYLLQHAYNPVDWHEWGEEAFAKAEAENKLMLISIGYSACHWCHVMAHECFEDEETAALMNSLFVCIKVDREELPDVDQIYMDACQLLSGSGGWPLNAFALPDKRPIHALTYAPKEKWHNILQSVNDLWINKSSMAYEYAEKLSAGIKNISLPPANDNEETSTENLTNIIFDTIQSQYDPVFGGINRAPKFPMPSIWKFLLQYAHLNKNEQAFEMAVHTTNQICLGGIHDHAGGGFARYSVDEKWFVPHFEKMLYDNAQMISLLSYAYAVKGDSDFKTTALKTINFCNDVLSSGNGLYYSAIDADSEGEEGLFYTYTFDELATVLKNESDIFANYFQCSREGNFEKGRNILFAIDTRKNAAEKFGMEADAFESFIENCLSKLKTYRSKRISPGIDNKCICSWNALMLKALSEAALYLKEPALITKAEQLAAAMLNLFNSEKGLKRIEKDGIIKIDALLEDYASLADAFIALYQCSLDEKHLIEARKLTEICVEKFYRSEHGFFAFKHKGNFITEKFDTTDDVINSGNSMMANVLWKLSFYFSKSDWKTMADNMLKAMRPLLKSSGPWYSNWASLQLFSENGTSQYILSAKTAEREKFPLSVYTNEANAILGFAGESGNIPLFDGKYHSGKNLIYPCKNMECYVPLEINETNK